MKIIVHTFYRILFIHFEQVGKQVDVYKQLVKKIKSELIIRMHVCIQQVKKNVPVSPDSIVTLNQKV